MRKQQFATIVYNLLKTWLNPNTVNSHQVINIKFIHWVILNFTRIILLCKIFNNIFPPTPNPDFGCAWALKFYHIVASLLFTSHKTIRFCILSKLLLLFNIKNEVYPLNIWKIRKFVGHQQSIKRFSLSKLYLEIQKLWTIHEDEMIDTTTAAKIEKI